VAVYHNSLQRSLLVNLFRTWLMKSWRNLLIESLLRS